jgi:hypothetical protein
MDVFGRKAKAADRRVEFLKELPQRVADNPHKAYRWIEDRLAFVIQNDTPDFLGPRYTEVWHLFVNQFSAYLAIAARAARIEKIAGTQELISSVEKALRQIADGTYKFCGKPYTAEQLAIIRINYTRELAQLKERLMAEKYGPITWPVKERERWYYDIGSPVYKTAGAGKRQLTPEEIETAAKELDRR